MAELACLRLVHTTAGLGESAVAVMLRKAGLAVLAQTTELLQAFQEVLGLAGILALVLELGVRQELVRKHQILAEDMLLEVLVAEGLLGMVVTEEVHIS